jgi:uncharacterized surface protein with fasciclin (FAS1) repeats
MMIKNLRNRYCQLILILTVAFASCKNQFNQHDAITDPALTSNLLQQINQDANLSKFSQYLVQTGYDKVIASSKTFTVWAPTNAAFQNVDPALLADTARLKQFIANHISNQSYTTNMAQPSLTVKTLNGKNATFTATTFETANILQANRYVANGILNVIDAAIIPKMNIWEYINNLTNVGQLQKAYLLSQNYSYQDTTQATITGYGSNGKPILQPGTGVVNKNYYLNQTANLQNEDQKFTYIVLTDAAFTSESNKVTKYFATSTPDSTAKLAAFNVTKDLVIPGVYAQSALPDTLLSVNNVKVPVSKGLNVVSTYNASNGIVYVMSSVNFRVTDKITPIVIQGENPAYFSRTDKNADILYRLRNDPNGVPYKDIFIATNTAATLTPLFTAYYTINNANSVTYKVYERAINEQLSAPVPATATTALVPAAPIIFSQQLTVYSPYSGITAFVATPVAYLNYNEVLIGTFTLTRYGFLKLANSGANSATAGLNSLSLDYLKLVPVLP